MRRDTLAAGARKAQFSAGSASVNEPIELKNVAPEDEVPEVLTPQEPVAPAAPKKIFKPLAGVLLVRRTEAQLGNGIIITETMEKDQPAEGTVLAAGPNEQDIHQGDYIVFGKYAGAEFRLNGETLLLMDATEVKGTLTDYVEEPPQQNDWTPQGCTSIGRA